MFYRSIGMIFVLILVSGCAAKSNFIYTYPEANHKKSLTNMVAAVAQVKDLRQGEKKIDNVYVNDPLKDIQSIIKEELQSTGFFQKVFVISDENTDFKPNVIIEPSLSELKWEVPEYEEMLGKVFVVSFLTGGIGGLIYGSTGTDVYGSVDIHISLVESNNGKTLFENTYNGRYEENMPKLNCDTPETKSIVIGKALKQELKTLKVDLHEVVESYRENTVLSISN